MKGVGGMGIIALNVDLNIVDNTMILNHPYSKGTVSFQRVAPVVCVLSSPGSQVTTVTVKWTLASALSKTQYKVGESFQSTSPSSTTSKHQSLPHYHEGTTYTSTKNTAPAI